MVIFLRRPEISFARLTTCLVEKLRIFYHRNPPWRLLMCASFCLAHTHIKCAHPHITDISFQSVFKLPRILVKHCQDPFLLFLLISCAYRVSGCPHSLLRFSSPLHSLHLCALNFPFPLCQQKQTSGYTQCPMGAPSALRRLIRIGQHGTLLLHACLFSLHLLPTKPSC